MFKKTVCDDIEMDINSEYFQFESYNYRGFHERRNSIRLKSEIVKKFKKKKSKNIKIKNQKKQIKIKFEKKGFKVNLTFDITEYALENFLNILASI